jgi:hypothetical protein
VNFGDYLVELNIIQEQDLVRALEIQKTDKVPLGQLALQQGLIDNKALFRILSLQRKDGGRNQTFGQLAIQLGYLTEEQISELLEKQIHTNRLLGELLVSQGFVSQVGMIKALKKFRAANKNQ